MDPRASTEYCQRTAIVGLGGVGKTQVAIEAAYRIRDIRPDCSVFWVPAVDATSFENAYREIGQRLNVKGIDKDDADTKKLVNVALSDEGSGKWLLVVDNADDTTLLLDKTSSYLARYLPSSKNGSILFTTRNHEVAVDLADSPKDDIFQLGEMSDAEAHQLLATGLDDAQIHDTEKTTQLLAFLENLPLAIRQASACMAKKQISTAKYLHFCQSSDDDTIELLSRDFEDRGRYRNAKNPIATTWLISFENIGKADPRAADILKFICFVSPKDIPRSLLPSAKSLMTEEAIGTLKAYAFLAERDCGSSYDIHRLVQIAARNWLKLKDEWQIWGQKALLRVNEEFPDPQHENREVWKQYLPHAECILCFCTSLVEGKKSELELLPKVGFGFLLLGNYKEPEAGYRKALEMQEKLLNSVHSYTPENMDRAVGSSRLLDNFGVILTGRGEDGRAEATHRKVFALFKELLGYDHPRTLTSMVNIGGALLLQGKYEEGEAMFRQALELQEKVLGCHHPDTLLTMSNLGAALNGQGKYEEAEAMVRQTLELQEKVLGCDHPDTLASVINLVCALKPRDKHEEAEAIHRKAVTLCEMVLGYDHPETLKHIDNLGAILHGQGKSEEAEVMFRNLLKLREKVLGYDHPDTLRSMNNLGVILRSQGRYEEAKAIYRKE